MNIRYLYGPNHNKTASVQDCGKIEICKSPSVKILFDPHDIINMDPLCPALKLKIGRYWRTGEHDKYGNTIFAWTGWK